jgi:hypothetical protein
MKAGSSIHIPAREAYDLDRAAKAELLNSNTESKSPAPSV